MPYIGIEFDYNMLSVNYGGGNGIPPPYRGPIQVNGKNRTVRFGCSMNINFFLKVYIQGSYSKNERPCSRNGQALNIMVPRDRIGPPTRRISVLNLQFLADTSSILPTSLQPMPCVQATSEHIAKSFSGRHVPSVPGRYSGPPRP